MLLYKTRVLNSIGRSTKAAPLLRARHFQATIVSRDYDTRDTRFPRRFDPPENGSRNPKLILILTFERSAAAKLNKSRTSLGFPAFTNECPLLFPDLSVQHIAICLESIKSLNESWKLLMLAFFPHVLPMRNELTNIGMASNVTSSHFAAIANILKSTLGEKLSKARNFDQTWTEWRRRVLTPFCRTGISLQEARDKVKILKSMHPEGISLGWTAGAGLVLTDLPPLSSGNQRLHQSRLIWSSLAEISDDPTYWPPQERVS